MNDSQETRGRKRNSFYEMVAEQVKAWHEQSETDGTPLSKRGRVTVGPVKEAAKTVNSFRNSFAYRDLREEFGDVFVVFAIDKHTFGVRAR